MKHVLSNFPMMRFDYDLDSNHFVTNWVCGYLIQDLFPTQVEFFFKFGSTTRCHQTNEYQNHRFLVSAFAAEGDLSYFRP